MVKYKCLLCKKKFKYKSQYNKHKNRKSLCVKGSELKKIENEVAEILLSISKNKN
jgi:DNA-directed RNA polymerase subunit RPC12/RpoP